MHINVSSVSESQKLNKLALDSSDGASELPEDKGFFSQLSAMIDGDSQKKVDEQTISVAETESELKTQDSAEELDLADDANSSEQLTSQLDSDALASDQVASTQALSETEQAQLAEQTVDESNQLLGRLDQASKALQTANGNELPPKAASAVDEQSDDFQGHAVVIGSKTSQVDAASDANSDEALAEISPLVARFVENAQDNVTSTASTQSMPIVQSVEGEHVVLESESSMVNPQAVALVGELTNGAESESTDAVLINTPSGVSGQPAGAVNEELATAGSGEATVSTNETGNSDIPASTAIENSSVANGSSTIQWGTPQTSVDDQIAQELANKARPAAVSQSVQQALNAQALAQQAQASGQAPVTSTPLTTEGQFTPQLTPNAAMMNALQSSASQEQAVLKAALGAKAAASLGQLGGADSPSTSGTEASFAQQLSQAAGPLGLNAQALNRSDQAAAQMPMTLNREMASEQVAERMQMMLSKNLKNIDIRLDPPELGRMQIRMNMNGDTASIQFTVANQQARDIIEQSMPRLREMLSQQGVQLGESSVQQQSAGQQQGRYATGNETGSGQGSSSQHAFGEENLEPDVNLDLNVTAKRDGISYYA
ncbi:flagellar hook-length control protein FliK [Vibrio sinensis]|uniref:Flagellar hook-length control protein FliK n=1 Tax=Vibrio sinensis TaxID=2302434 RepID=A0A3A6Q8M9_9VIBR|nr:flagellar hook-length control protein FliK [Vibrio sinensis]RJX67488.1 flagellar hook-length control protein FliK [Vibrio sinensis]